MDLKLAGRTALIVVDMQRAFVEPGEAMAVPPMAWWRAVYRIGVSKPAAWTGNGARATAQAAPAPTK